MKLPGRYKGTRRRRDPPVSASCTCGSKSQPANAKRVEECPLCGKLAAIHLEIRA
jgi:hypothetical protein